MTLLLITSIYMFNQVWMMDLEEGKGYLDPHIPPKGI